MKLWNKPSRPTAPVRSPTLHYFCQSVSMPVRRPTSAKVTVHLVLVQGTVLASPCWPWTCHTLSWYRGIRESGSSLLLQQVGAPARQSFPTTCSKDRSKLVGAPSRRVPRTGPSWALQRGESSPHNDAFQGPVHSQDDIDAMAEMKMRSGGRELECRGRQSERVRE